MKVEVIDEARNREKMYYPYLGIHVKTGLIVYFTGFCHGFVIVPDTQKNVGVFSGDWEESQFEPFKGKVILEND